MLDISKEKRRQSRSHNPSKGSDADVNTKLQWIEQKDKKLRLLCEGCKGLIVPGGVVHGGDIDHLWDRRPATTPLGVSAVQKLS